MTSNRTDQFKLGVPTPPSHIERFPSSEMVKRCDPVLEWSTMRSSYRCTSPMEMIDDAWTIGAPVARSNRSISQIVALIKSIRTMK